MKKILIDSSCSDQRLDKFLMRYLHGAGKNFLYKMIRKKNITLNDKRCDGSERLEIGDCIKLWMSDDTIEKFSAVTTLQNTAAPELKISIIFEDSDIIIFNKPAGILSQRASRYDYSVNDFLISHMKKNGEFSDKDRAFFTPSVVNRLDRNTSGIILAGKTLKGLRTLSQMLRERTAKKEYLAVVIGEIKKSERLNAYLSKDNRNNKVQISLSSIPSSDKIETEYIPLFFNGTYTLVLIHLLTGKSHQIRAHLAFLNHPLAGDPKYGSERINRQLKNEFGISNQLLHSWRITLRFCDNGSDEINDKTFRSEPPHEFQNILGLSSKDFFKLLEKV